MKDQASYIVLVSDGTNHPLGKIERKKAVRLAKKLNTLSRTATLWQQTRKNGAVQVPLN